MQRRSKMRRVKQAAKNDERKKESGDGEKCLKMEERLRRNERFECTIDSSNSTMKGQMCTEVAMRRGRKRREDACGGEKRSTKPVKKKKKRKKWK